MGTLHMHFDEAQPLHEHAVTAGCALVRLIAVHVRRRTGSLIEVIRAREAEARTLLDTLPDLVWYKDCASRYLWANHAFLETMRNEHAIVSITDTAGNITYVNDKFVQTSGYSREMLIGENCRMLKSGTPPQALFDDMRQTTFCGKAWHGDVCNRTKDGGLYWVNTTIVPFLDTDGQPVQYVSVRTDITLANAGHAIETGGTITLRTGTEDEQVGGEIEDSGTGIPPEHLQRIFDPFFTPKPVGTGTGFSLSHSIGKKHHGEIDAASEPRKGTRFRVRLPIAHRKNLEVESQCHA